MALELVVALEQAGEGIGGKRSYGGVCTTADKGAYVPIYVVVSASLYVCVVEGFTLVAIDSVLSPEAQLVPGADWNLYLLLGGAGGIAQRHIGGC